MQNIPDYTDALLSRDVISFHGRRRAASPLWFGLAWGHGAGGHMNTYACRFHIKLVFQRGHAIGGGRTALAV